VLMPACTALPPNANFGFLTGVTGLAVNIHQRDTIYIAKKKQKFSNYPCMVRNQVLDSEARQQMLLDQHLVSYCFLHQKQPVLAHPCLCAKDSIVGHVSCSQIHCLHHRPATDTNAKHQYNASAW